MHEQSKCGGCGQPRHLAHDSDTDGWWNVETVVCQACAVIANESNEHDEPGTMVGVKLDPDYSPRDPSGQV